MEKEEKEEKEDKKNLPQWTGNIQVSGWEESRNGKEFINLKISSYCRLYPAQ
jgi:hypothetical protein